MLEYWTPYTSLNFKVYCIEILCSGFLWNGFLMLSLVYTKLFSDFVTVFSCDTFYKILIFFFYCTYFFTCCQDQDHYSEAFI